MSTLAAETPEAGGFDACQVASKTIPWCCGVGVILDSDLSLSQSARIFRNPNSACVRSRLVQKRDFILLLWSA